MAENTVRVISYDTVESKLIMDQVDAVCEDILPDAVKIGMLSDIETMKVVSEKIKQWKLPNIVVDPVMYAKNGCALMEETSITTIICSILPLATLITPNIPEAEKILGEKITNLQEMEYAAKKIFSITGSSVLIKGGHSEGDAIDCLYDGRGVYRFHSKRVKTSNTHGTGCTLSSAIASGLAQGHSVKEAVEAAKVYITGAIQHSLELGKGHGPTNHFYAMNRMEIK